MKIFYKTSATATGGRDGRPQVDDGSISFDLVSFQNDSTGADEKHQRAEYGKYRRADEKWPHGMGEKFIHNNESPETPLPPRLLQKPNRVRIAAWAGSSRFARSCP